MELVLLRHGQSTWNRDNRFTGWQDVDLTEAGEAEARSAGLALKEQGYAFDIAYTSVLKRAIRTLNISLEQMDQLWIPVIKSWRLNERHYGALTGLNKAETAAKYGEEQVHIWRRSYSTPPPLLEQSDPRHPSLDPRYKSIEASQLPAGEALLHCKDRVVPFWESEIVPALHAQKQILIVAHGNSLRALVQHLENLSEDEIMAINIPTGLPLVYNLDKNLLPLDKRYIGDPQLVAAAMAEVAAQGHAK